jgi:hypothetical protein
MWPEYTTSPSSPHPHYGDETTEHGLDRERCWKGNKVLQLLKNAYRTPFDQMYLFTRVSMRTSCVPICFSANLRISLIARGARFLKPLKKENILDTRSFNTYMPWMYLWMWIVYSRVTSLFSAFFDLRSVFFVTILNSSATAMNFYPSKRWVFSQHEIMSIFFISFCSLFGRMSGSGERYMPSIFRDCDKAKQVS